MQALPCQQTQLTVTSTWCACRRDAATTGSPQPRTAQAGHGSASGSTRPRRRWRCRAARCASSSAKSTRGRGQKRQPRHSPTLCTVRRRLARGRAGSGCRRSARRGSSAVRAAALHDTIARLLHGQHLLPVLAQIALRTHARMLAILRRALCMLCSTALARQQAGLRDRSGAYGVAQLERRHAAAVIHPWQQLHQSFFAGFRLRRTWRRGGALL
jgi:hypothetical protein